MVFEGAQEGAEEGLGSLARGYNVNVVDPSRDITEGLGVSGVMGTVLGGGIGAGVGAIGGIARGAPPPTEKEQEQSQLLEREKQLKAEKEKKKEEEAQPRLIGYDAPVPQITDQTPKPETPIATPVEGVQKQDYQDKVR